MTQHEQRKSHSFAILSLSSFATMLLHPAYDQSRTRPSHTASAHIASARLYTLLLFIFCMAPSSAYAIGDVVLNLHPTSTSVISAGDSVKYDFRILDYEDHGIAEEYLDWTFTLVNIDGGDTPPSPSNTSYDGQASGTVSVDTQTKPIVGEFKLTAKVTAPNVAHGGEDDQVFSVVRIDVKVQDIAELDEDFESAVISHNNDDDDNDGTIDYAQTPPPHNDDEISTPLTITLHKAASTNVSNVELRVLSGANKIRMWHRYDVDGDGSENWVLIDTPEEMTWTLPEDSAAITEGVTYYIEGIAPSVSSGDVRFQAKVDGHDHVADEATGTVSGATLRAIPRALFANLKYDIPVYFEVYGAVKAEIASVELEVNVLDVGLTSTVNAPDRMVAGDAVRGDSPGGANGSRNDYTVFVDPEFLNVVDLSTTDSYHYKDAKARLRIAYINDDGHSVQAFTDYVPLQAFSIIMC